MVTIVLGKKNNSQKCRLLTLQENADEPRRIEFPVPSEKNPLKPSIPKWANYVKGVVQYFEGIFSSETQFHESSQRSSFVHIHQIFRSSSWIRRSHNF